MIIAAAFLAVTLVSACVQGPKTEEGAYSPGQRPGESFRDSNDCPKMIVVPAGSFRMSDLHGGGYRNETPVHRVTISQPFAVGVYEVTFDEWDACVAGGGCRAYHPGDGGWGRGTRPVINVSWWDAIYYVSWLSRVTGANYRLMSEAEWEYAARAGTTTRYHWGYVFYNRRANGGRNIGKTVPVGGYAANEFGLHDMHGNVWEWVGDCWHNRYDRAPDNGRSWTNRCYDKNGRVIRGGSWDYNTHDLRVSNRTSRGVDTPNPDTGFRVARALLPLAP